MYIKCQEIYCFCKNVLAFSNQVKHIHLSNVSCVTMAKNKTRKETNSLIRKSRIYREKAKQT